MQYWLMKSEPDVWSIEQQIKAGEKGADWDGVRNYQAANNLKKMQKGDLCFFYHSNIGKEIVGIVEVIKTAFIDLTDKKKRFVNYLDSKGIETRPIISGNFLNQPAAKLYKLNKEKRNYPNTQAVQELGFLIGLHTKKIDKKKLKLIHDAFFKIESI